MQGFRTSRTVRQRGASVATGISALLAAGILAGCGNSVSTSTATRPPVASQSAATLTSTSAAAGDSGVHLTATPNPVPGGVGVASTTLRWSAPAGTAIIIRVSLDGGTPKLFAAGAGSGSKVATFIVARENYTFTLTDAGNPATTLASVVVTRPS